MRLETYGIPARATFGGLSIDSGDRTVVDHAGRRRLLHVTRQLMGRRPEPTSRK